MVALNVLGLNCGTSIDGIDVAHCRISAKPDSDDVQIEVLSYVEVPVDPELRKQVLRLCLPDREAAATSLAEICDLNFALGRQFSHAVLESGVNLDEVDIIASHGQTLWHQPLGEERSTLQMAEPAVIAQKTKKTVVSGFRVAELAAGRQGAPLAGFFEACLLSDPKVTRIVQNIGGIGNTTALAAATSTQKTPSSTYLAFDTGPGNVLIDASMRILTNGEQHYDKDGLYGRKGADEINENIVRDFLDNEPYFSRSPPKTTGRELFSDDVARDLVEKMRGLGMSSEGIIATVTRITSESIAQAYERFVLPYLSKTGRPPISDEIYICGGGVYNPNLLDHLQSRFPHSRVMKLDDAPAPLAPNAKEAVMFALLGFLSVCGRTVPLATDAESSEPAILGVITPGENYQKVMRAVVGEQGFAENRVLGRILM